MSLLFVALGILLSGGAMAAALGRWPRAASLAGATAAALGSIAGALFALRQLEGGDLQVSFAWPVPSGGIVVGCDALSAFFLLPLFVLGAIAAVYGHGYLLAHTSRPGREGRSLGPAWLAFDLLLASMAVVVTARHAVLFLVAWEIMSISSFFLVSFEHEHAEVKRAGWVYLIAAHVGAAFLVAMFVLLGSATGSLVLGEGSPLRAGALSSAILLLGLAGFGVKAGLVPLHVWLPEAHAAAPSHVSALMSGVLTKMGVYGILRMTIVAGPPPFTMGGDPPYPPAQPVWWGPLLITLGLAGALYGVVLASYQRDIKRALAYSTIENVGLVFIGLGLGLFGHATGRPILGALGLFGGLLHAWNHTLMKGLLFLGAGAVVHETGTRDIEQLGGILKRAPLGSSLFVLGAIAIAGLPPLNGFAGEWLLYRALLDGAIAGAPGSAVVFMLAVGAVSAVGALAALSFVRLSGIALLGEPRSEGAARAREVSPRMLLPMGALAALCVIMGLRPGLALSAIGGAALRIAPGAAAGAVRASLAPVEHAALALWGAGFAAAIVAFALARRRRQDATWGCGYAAPTARMQYTGRAFGGLLGDLLPRALRARTEITRPSGLFPAAGDVRSRFEDPVTRGLYEPALDRAANRFARLRWLQQGAVHVYLLYILAAVVLGLAWASVGGE